MPNAISNTSPLLYLHRIGSIHWLPQLFDEVWTPEAVRTELQAGRTAAMALALENQDRVVLLDDMLARRTAQAAGLQVWGTLKILLEAKSHGLIDTVEPYVTQLRDSGMWISAEVKQRILKLAGEL
jgi:predicted nucleic acid-binding protein